MFNNPFKKPDTNMPDNVIDERKKDLPEAVGKIIKISDEGWAFITSKDVKFTRIFMHWTALKHDTKKFTDLKIGMRVKFVPQEVEGKGTRAIKVEVLD